MMPVRAETPPPRLTDRSFFASYLGTQPALPSEYWHLFLAARKKRAGQYGLAAAAVYSSNIENIDIELDRYLAATEWTVGGDGLSLGEMGLERFGKEKEIEEVSALKEAYGIAQRSALDEETLLDIHDAIGAPSLIRSRRGRYREERIGVGSPEGLVYMAVEPENVAAEMAKVFDDLDELMARPLSVDEAFYHAALLHVVFAHIHPFADGNGRTARLLEKWFLAHHLGADAWQIPSEHHYWTHRAQYYENLLLGINFYFLDYRSGGHHGQGVIPFLTMLPDALAATEPPPFPTKELGEVGQVVTGGTPRTSEPSYWDGDIAWATPTDITALDGEKYIRSTERTITEAGLAESAATLLPPGSVLVCTRATIGELAVNAVPMATNQGFKSVVPAAEGDGEYLYYVLRHFRHDLERLGQGGTFEEVSKRDFERLEVPFPPRPIRQRITRTLATWDRALAHLDALVAALEERQRGVVQRLLTGTERLAEFDTHTWPQRPLDQLVASISSGTSVNSDESLPREGTPRVLKTSAVTSGYFEPEESKPIVPEEIERANTNPTRGSILMSRMNTEALVGASGYVKDDYPGLFLPDRLWRIETTSDVDPRWLGFLLGSPRMRSVISDRATGTSGSMKNISQASLLSIRVEVPPLPEQRAIAAVLDAGEREIAVRRAERDALARQQRGLMQRLLTGRVRLPVTP